MGVSQAAVGAGRNVLNNRLILPITVQFGTFVGCMRSFQRPESLEPVPGDVVATLRRIDRAAGAEARYADQLA